MLQRGHGGKAVEGSLGSETFTSVDQGFNGATAVKPWRDPLSTQGFFRDMRKVLQRGHGGKAVEGVLLWGRSMSGNRQAFSSDRQLGAVRRRPTHHRRGGLRAQVVKVQGNQVIRAFPGVPDTSDRSPRSR